jgi:Putative adhesin
MSKAKSEVRNGGRIAICALAALIIPWSLVHAGRVIQERLAADPQGEVEIVNVAGRVEVDGWDRSEIEVSGTAGDGVERVDVTSSGSHTSIHVMSRSSHTWGSDGEAHLVVHVPVKSAITATLVSADFKVTGVLGDLKLQAVSGSLSGDAGGNVRATTVSGGVRLTAHAARVIEIKTISGDIQLAGGGGEVDITTVSGGAKLDLGDVTRGRFKSVSGDVTAALALTTDVRIESESVSGDTGLTFAAAPAAEFDVQSFSGDIKNCFGPKPVQPQYGPGSRLQFTNGDGRARVRVNTKSGDVRLCIKGSRGGNASGRSTSGSDESVLSLVQSRGTRMELPYVF